MNRTAAGGSDWPAHRPPFVPTAVWTFARELEAFLDPEPLDTVRRLLGPSMAPTWDRLARRLPPSGTEAADLNWRLLLDLFYTSAPAAQQIQAARMAQRRAEALLDEISGYADGLAERLDELHDLSERFGLTCGADLGDLPELVAGAGHPYTRALYATSGTDAPEPDPLCWPSPSDLVLRIANAARATSAAFLRPDHVPPGSRKQVGIVRDWVRRFDLRFPYDYRWQIHLQDLSFGHEDLARIGSAVLRIVVTAEAVKYARRTDPER